MSVNDYDSKINVWRELATMVLRHCVSISFSPELNLNAAHIHHEIE
jgi:hypothetical protein